MIALFGALVISAGCTFMLGRKISQPGRASDPRIRYLAAARMIQVGEIVKADDVVYADWPASQPAPGAFTKPDDLAGRAAVYPIEKGQIVLNQYLAQPGAGIGLTTRIPEGMRAVALKSDEIVGVAGFLFPGSRVDVLVTYRPGQGPDPVTSTVLQNVPVLAIGHDMQPDPAGKPTSGDVVTILASPNDAEKAVLASTQGTIHFVLRNGADRASTSNATIRLGELGGPVAEKPSMRATAGAAPKARAYVVQTIMGDKQASTTFN
jgi:pilus assembly protein CpaB